MTEYERRSSPDADTRDLPSFVPEARRQVRLVAPVPAPLAPRPAPTLGAYAPARSLQRQAVQPALQAALTLQRLQADHQAERLRLQRQLEDVQASLPPGAEPGTRQAAAPPGLPPVFQRQAGGRGPGLTPTAADWTGLYAHEMGQHTPDARGLYPSGPVAPLQRRVAQGLAQVARSSRLPAVQRYAELGEALASLGRQPLGAAVVRGSLGQMPVGERAAIQRALDEADGALQRQEEQAARAAQAGTLQRRLAELEQEGAQPVLQRIQARRGAGRPLPGAVQRHLEQGLNTDLSQVRVHDDAEADSLAKGVKATAFTTGADIFFRRGRYEPNSRSGLELLAHEVTHTVQQAQGRVGTGIDPDSGLEAEARSMGARLARGGPIIRPGSRVRRPGARTQPHVRPQAVASSPSPTLQRWPDPLASLKKVGKQASGALSSTASRVRQTAQRAVQTTVARVRTATAPAVKLARQASTKVKATAQKVRTSLDNQVKEVRSQAGRAGRRVQAAVRGTAGEVRATARKASQTLHQQAQRLARQAATVVRQVQKTTGQGVAAVTRRAKQAARPVLNKAGAAARSVTTRARSVASAAKKAAQPMLDRVNRTARDLLARAQQTKSVVQARAQKTYRQAKALAALPPQARRKALMAGLSATKQKLSRGAKKAAQPMLDRVNRTARDLLARAQQSKLGVQAQKTYRQAKDFIALPPQDRRKVVVDGLKTAGTAVRKTAQEGWSLAVRTGATAKSTLINTVNTIKNSPRVQSMAASLKKAGIQVARVGTAIVVGGVVIAGAAALTAATGGLAGPALVAALFASGALGGAAGQLVENALRGKKWNDKINAKSLLTDGALGVVAGPAAKLVGGVVRAGARPLANVAGRVLPVAADAINPALRPAASYFALAARNRVGAWAKAAPDLGKKIAESRLGKVAGSAAALTRKGLGTATAWAGRTRLARGLNAIDESFSKDLRGVVSVPGQVGEALGKRVKSVKGAVSSAWRSQPALRQMTRNTRNAVEGLKDSAAVKLIKARNAVGAGWRGVETSATRWETDFRFNLAARGLRVDPSSSITGRLFSAAERSLTSMKTYVSSEARTIAGEVREQWYGSAGVGGVLRTGNKVKELVTANPALAKGWQQEQTRARHALVNAASRAMRNEATAAGQYLSKTVARRAAASRVTAEAVDEYAVRNLSGRFMTRASEAYRSTLPALNSFDPQRGWIGQLPRLYTSGVAQMAGGVQERWSALRNAGSMAAGVATAGGWISEEYFKKFAGDAAKSYKADETARYPNASHVAAGVQTVRDNAGKIAVSGLTGLSTETQGGGYMWGTPFNRAVISASQHGGFVSVTDQNELEEQPTEETPTISGPSGTPAQVVP